MHRSGAIFLCLAAALSTFARLPKQVAGADTLADNDGFLEIVTKETELKDEAEARDLDIELGNVVYPVQREEPVVAIENADISNNSAVMAEMSTSEAVALKEPYPVGTRSGIRMALIGLAGLMLFFAIHIVKQRMRNAPVGSDVLFESNGRVTFTEAGYIMSFVFVAAGLAEALRADLGRTKASGNLELLSSARWNYAQAGRILMAPMSTVITLGWIIGAPLFVMQLATIGFFIGMALRLFGSSLMLPHVKRAVELSNRRGDLVAKDVQPLVEDAEVDPELLVELMDHSLADATVLPSPAAQLGSGQEPPRLEFGEQATSDLLDAETLAAVAHEFQQLQQPQQLESAARDDRLRNIVSSAEQAGQEFQEHSELLEEASQLMQQLEKVPEGDAGVRDQADSAMAAGEETTGLAAHGP